jgi:lipoyl(octanoyl) transferase
LDKQQVIFSDWGEIDYKSAWDKQEVLLLENVAIKTAARKENADQDPMLLPTTNHLIFCEHSAVYTLGKSGNISNVLLTDEEMSEKGIEFYRTNRGGDITFHGEGQIVGYPILDLEKFKTDIGFYLRNIEEVIIKTIAEFGIKGERSSGETGVWIDNDIPGKERKICAIGVRCSRWITMHGFALNVNTDLGFFNNIVPCGIQDKKVTSIEKEIGYQPDIELVKEKLKKNFELVFNVTLLFN